MRRARIDLRVREDEKTRWQIEAAKKGIDLSEYIRRKMNGVAARRKVVQS